MENQPMMEATSDDKLWALLAYVLTPIVPIIILLMEDKKNRPFIRAHNAQALAWGLVNLVGGTILSSLLFFCFGLPRFCFGALVCIGASRHTTARWLKSRSLAISSDNRVGPRFHSSLKRPASAGLFLLTDLIATPIDSL